MHSSSTQQQRPIRNSRRASDDDEDSFVGFFVDHHSHHPRDDPDQDYVARLRRYRADSKAKRRDEGFNEKFEKWWKKFEKDKPSLCWKEQMRSMAVFKKEKEKN